jgi:hypothetical protein
VGPRADFNIVKKPALPEIEPGPSSPYVIDIPIELS